MIQVHDTPGTRRDEPPGFARLLAAFEMQERAEALVAPLLAELLRSIPQLRSWKRFTAGAWALGVRTAAEDRALGGRFARMDFEIRVDARQRAVTITRRSTVRSRDLTPDTLTVVMDAEGEAVLRTWAERAALDFASAYWARPGVRPLPAETGPT